MEIILTTGLTRTVSVLLLEASVQVSSGAAGGRTTAE
jgi:hypothetical protein